MKLMLAMGGAMFISAAASADVLYGVGQYGPFNTQGLYQIDTNTGAATFVGDTGVSEFNGIAYDRNTSTMYGYTTDAELYTIDITDGTSTLVVDFGTIVPEGDLAFHNGNLFASNGANFGNVDFGTAAFGFIGNMGAAANDVSGLAWGGGAMYGYSKNGGAEDSLIQLNLNTGVATQIGMTGINTNSSVGGLAYSAGMGGLFLSDGDSLFSINTLTGAATLIGSHTIVGISGIAFVPSPGALALLGVSMCCGIRRRRN